MALLFEHITGGAFAGEVRRMAARLGLRDANMLMAAMAFETGGTFDPSITNAIGATGLIQFTRTNAQDLGTSTASLSRMSRTEQLAFVEKHLARYLKPGRQYTIEDVYMAIFWPAAVGKPNQTVLFSLGSPAYNGNSPLDLDADGHITKGEAASKVRTIYRGTEVPFYQLEPRPPFVETGGGTGERPVLRPPAPAPRPPIAASFFDAIARAIKNAASIPAAGPVVAVAAAGVAAGLFFFGD